jgi:hypothetical protein
VRHTELLEGGGHAQAREAPALGPPLERADPSCDPVAEGVLYGVEHGAEVGGVFVHGRLDRIMRGGYSARRVARETISDDRQPFCAFPKEGSTSS